MSQTGPQAASKLQAVCEYRECACKSPRTIYTWPNAITLVRTIGAVCCALWGVYESSETLLLIGLAVFWIGDIVDGAVARLTATETRFGGALDIITDRACCAAFYLGWLAINPHLAIAIGIYVASFMVVDTLLSLSFLHWPIRSINYFDVVDSRVFAWNFSPIPKGANSAVFFTALVVLDSALLASIVAGISLCIKTVSLVRVQQLVHAKPVEYMHGPS